MPRPVDQMPSPGHTGAVPAPAQVARRRVLRRAVLGPRTRPGHGALGGPTGAEHVPAPGTVVGTVVDATARMLIVRTGHGDQRLAVTTSTVAWRGGPVSPTALRAGDRVLTRVRAAGDGERGDAAERIWAQIGRITGIILERDSDTLLVHGGSGRGVGTVVIPRRAADVIAVRFPRLEPGYLVDVIGLRRPEHLEGLLPATSQPPYRADQPPKPRPVRGGPPTTVSGTATWHESGTWHEDGADATQVGLSYPALDPDPCPPVQKSELGGGRRGLTVDTHPRGPGCVRLPYLSVGTVLWVRNDCTNHARPIPVTGCAALDRYFCDRCVACGASPRGRVADLTMAAFVDLGGDLAAGCFNATVTMDA